MKYKKFFFVILVSYIVSFFLVYETVKYNDVTCHGTHCEVDMHEGNSPTLLSSSSLMFTSVYTINVKSNF